MSDVRLKEFYDTVNPFAPRAEGRNIVIDLPDTATGLHVKKSIEEKFGFNVVARNENKHLTIISYTDTEQYYVDADHMWRVIKGQRITEYASDIGLLDFDNKRFLFQKTDTSTFINERQEATNFFFTNIIFYLKFLNHLELWQSGDNLRFRFVDNFDWYNRNVVFSSLRKEGRVVLEIPDNLPQFNTGDNLSPSFEDLLKIFNQVDKQMYLPKFFKNEIFERYSKPNREDKTTEALFQEIKEIRAVADQTLDIFMADLSIDKIKKDFIELKTKYFGQFREVISKITGQIIGLPVSVSAVAIATYNVKGVDGIGWLILLVYVVYSLFSSYLLKHYRQDLDEIEESIERDYTKELKQSYLKKESPDYKFFLKEKTHLKSKIKIVKKVLYLYFFLQTISHGAIIWIILNSLALPSPVTGPLAIFFGLLSLFLFKEEVSGSVSVAEKE